MATKKTPAPNTTEPKKSKTTKTKTPPKVVEEAPMSLEEFYGAMETTQTQTQVSNTSNSTISDTSKTFSYWDFDRKAIGDIEVDTPELYTNGYTLLYGCLSTETTKVEFANILKKSMDKYIKIRHFTTKYSPNLNIVLVYFADNTPVRMKTLICESTKTIIYWCDAKYYQVKDTGGFGKHMTDEMETKKKEFPHKCIMLNTGPFKLEDGTNTAPGFPVVWNFKGGYIDPMTKQTMFMYEVEPAYVQNPSITGITMASGSNISRYTIGMDEIISAIDDKNNQTLFLFHSEQLYTFVKKETLATFYTLQLDILAEMN